MGCRTGMWRSWERLAENLPVVVADPHQLQQVFSKTADNAFDAIETIPRPGRIEVETVVPLGVSGNFFFVTTGTGISNPDRIFEPFSSPPTVEREQAWGLSICYGIVHAHLAKSCSRTTRAPRVHVHRRRRLPLRKQAASSDRNT